jgi:hypothetical protein
MQCHRVYRTVTCFRGFHDVIVINSETRKGKGSFVRDRPRSYRFATASDTNTALIEELAFIFTRLVFTRPRTFILETAVLRSRYSRTRFRKISPSFRIEEGSCFLQQRRQNNIGTAASPRLSSGLERCPCHLGTIKTSVLRDIAQAAIYSDDSMHTEINVGNIYPTRCPVRISLRQTRDFIGCPRQSRYAYK